MPDEIKGYKDCTDQKKAANNYNYYPERNKTILYPRDIRIQ